MFIGVGLLGLAATALALLLGGLFAALLGLSLGATLLAAFLGLAFRLSGGFASATLGSHLENLLQRVLRMFT